MIAIWTVSAGNDYSYKFGETAVTGGTFQMNVASPPPSAAINLGYLGVATLILFKAGFALPDGKIADVEALEPQAIGAAEQFVLIYRPAQLPSSINQAWLKDFPPGLSCGRISGKQGSFVTFGPTDCSAVEVIVTPDPKGPNWT